jgi:hypothetical protein
MKRRCHGESEAAHVKSAQSELAGLDEQISVSAAASGFP